jgi:homoaconitate hydratase
MQQIQHAARRNVVRMITRQYSTTNSSADKQTMIEKIVQRFVDKESIADGQRVKSGDYVSVEPLHVMTHDNTSAVLSKFKNFFTSEAEQRISNPKQPVFTLDHNIQDKSETNLAKYAAIAKFATRHNIDHYGAGRGIGHQIMCEEGYAWPLAMVVASDSHSNMYGGLGCLGTPIVRTDAASIWATGKTWWLVPPITRVHLTGELQGDASGKDVIITLCGLFNKDQVLNHAIEFYGDGVQSLSIDERLTIANMTTEWGALAGVFSVDDLTLQWMHGQGGRGKKKFTNEMIDQVDKDRLIYGVPDQGAQYARELTLDLNTVTPHISGPNHVKVMNSLRDLEQRKVKINKAYIVSCVNSRVNDLSKAAQVVKKVQTELGRNKIDDNVELYIAAASNEVQKESEQLGDWQVLVNAGAKVLPSGCGPCIGLGTGLLQDGEIGISATNRNFKGRMGSRTAEAYLASPAVVAASAMRGYISGPVLSDLQSSSSTQQPQPDDAQVTPSPVQAKRVQLIEGFPKKITGQVVFCHQDNLNTDGIYPGKYTYIEVEPEKQATVAMENYDPKFQSIVKPGHILVGGFNFGTGSSREQAATALKHKGIPLIIAGSFSETYKRNATNNGYLTIEVPQLVENMKKEVGTNELTVLTDLNLDIDFESSTITDSKENKYVMSPVGPIAQELILFGGLENWVMNKLKNNTK